MSGSPQYKVYTPTKEYVAACKFAEDAAALVSLYGEGATVRYDHKHVVWTEGSETQSAGNSYDFAAEVMLDRREALFAKWRQER